MPGKDLAQLKVELQLFQKMLAKPKTCQESCHEMIRDCISGYIEMALKADETPALVKQQMTLLCHQDLLVPQVLHDWVLEEVETLTSTLTVEEVHEIDSCKIKLVTEQGPLFCKKVLYHTSVCCHAVTLDIPTEKMLIEFLSPQKNMVYHHLSEASMSVIAESQDIAPYLIAIERNTIYVALRGKTCMKDWTKDYSSLGEGKLLLIHIHLHCNISYC